VTLISSVTNRDATYDRAVQYNEIDNPVTPPNAMHALILPELRGYDGGPYECKTDYTCKSVEDLKAKLGKKDEL
jgi:hypothetical protein